MDQDMRQRGISEQAWKHKKDKDHKLDRMLYQEKKLLREAPLMSCRKHHFYKLVNVYYIM